jgi:hypothetical protein
MTQQYHTRRRFAMLIVLVALVIVVIKSISTGSAYTIPEENAVTGYSRGISFSIISLASEANDFSWRPLMRFFK